MFTQITKELNKLGDHHLLIENEYKVRKETLYILHFTHLIKEINYRKKEFLKMYIVKK